MAAEGKLIRINNPGTEGAIERSDDQSFALYQFQIPQDVAAGATIIPADEGKAVLFNIGTGRTAISVQKKP